MRKKKTETLNPFADVEFYNTFVDFMKKEDFTIPDMGAFPRFLAKRFPGEKDAGKREAYFAHFRSAVMQAVSEPIETPASANGKGDFLEEATHA